MISRELKNIILDRLGIVVEHVDDTHIQAIIYESTNNTLTSKEKIIRMKKLLDDYGYNNINIKYKTVKPRNWTGYSKDKYNKAATKWAEEHGIVEYKVKSKYMIYNVSYPAYLSEPRRTYQFKVDLTTGKTVESKQLKRYDPKGVYNRH